MKDDFQFSGVDRFGLDKGRMASVMMDISSLGQTIQCRFPLWQQAERLCWNLAESRLEKLIKVPYTTNNEAV